MVLLDGIIWFHNLLWCGLAQLCVVLLDGKIKIYNLLMVRPGSAMCGIIGWQNKVLLSSDGVTWLSYVWYCSMAKYSFIIC